MFSSEKLRRLRTFVDLRWEGLRPRLVLLERFEPHVRWTLRGLLVTGILASVFKFTSATGLTLSLCLTGIELLLERTLFRYTSLYIQALPDFHYDPDKWSSMAFLLGSGTLLNAVGFVFTDRNYASKMFGLFRAWNHGGDDDPENNIRLTFVIDEDKYWIYVYPSFRKKTVRHFFRSMARRSRTDKRGKEHLGLIAFAMFCKAFATAPSFALGHFLEAQRKGQPFLLIPMLHCENAPPKIIDDIAPIRKLHFKAKPAHQMNPEDDEYGHWRLRPRG